MNFHIALTFNSFVKLTKEMHDEPSLLSMENIGMVVYCV